jgi:predicted ATPase
MRLLRLHLTNFLSYRSAILEFGDFVALVGPNASGKSNAVAAIKLLREIPLYGLPTAIARRGGFDQLRHRSAGRPIDPALRLDFLLPGADRESHYELKLSGIAGKRYEVKSESAQVYAAEDREYSFSHTREGFSFFERMPEGTYSSETIERPFRVPPGQSVIASGPTFGGYLVSRVLESMQTVEVNPALVGELQEPSSTREFEPDGSNAASVFESLDRATRNELVDQLSAIVPGIDQIEVRRFADKLTVAFFQKAKTGKARREFLAKQMSDGTLRAFSIFLAMLQPARPTFLVIEEPEIAIHLGALRTLVDILQQQASESQILITTHSADIVDTLDVDALRVVWSDGNASQISRVAQHSLDPVRKGLITPGELLRSDALDPATV